MANVAAEPVSEAVFALLQDAAVQAALPGGLHDDVPANPGFPFGWYEIASEIDRRGFGGGGLPELELRTHVFSLFAGKAEAQAANRLIVGVLKDAAIMVTGYRQCGTVFYDQTIPIPDGELDGVKVHEIVSFFRVYVEEV